MPENELKKWGLVVDLDACNGCQACVTACSMENNVAYVGEDDAGYGRSLQWIRVERYWDGEYPNITARFRPIMCQQCGRAPCESVCPVFATVHSDAEQINVQVYNRCIGTRYCANNCPYIVRNFEWFDYSGKMPEPLNYQFNPDVTVRRRGVIEKCTFCIQRIRRGEETAKMEGGTLRDGEITTACAQACPTQAIIFGDLTDPNSRVSSLVGSARTERMLEDLGTQPHVYYLRGISGIKRGKI
jgi:Fe-S-cluster-containing dehydrogenase component